MNETPNYDAFLSYSSSDIKHVRYIQRFIENYKPPRKLLIGKAKLKLFRDKDDQGVTHDYSERFNKWIETIPGFLFIGSSASLKSKPVETEIRQFVKKDSQNLLLAWIDDKAEPVFPAPIAEKFPNAIYADFRMLKKRNPVTWLLFDKGKFKKEALRIIAALLSSGSNRHISLDELVQRDSQRTVRRRWGIASVALAILFAFFGYLFSTPEYAWKHTSISAKDATQYQIRIVDGKPKLWLASEVILPWRDSISDESGHDSDVSLYQLDEYGTIEGELKFHTFQIEREIESVKEATGSFKIFDDTTLLSIAYSVFEEETIESAGFQLTEKEYYGQPSFSIDPLQKGMAYFSSEKDKHSYALKFGGIYRTHDFGKTWDKLQMNFWDSFSDITHEINSDKSYAVILTEIAGTNLGFPLDDKSLLPSLWYTKNDGQSWHQVKSNKQNINLRDMNLIWMTASGNIFGIIPRNGDTNQLIVYKKRTLIERLLQQYDDF
jgi:hypothetical protein